MVKNYKATLRRSVVRYFALVFPPLLVAFAGGVRVWWPGYIAYCLWALLLPIVWRLVFSTRPVQAWRIVVMVLYGLGIGATLTMTMVVNANIWR